MADKNKTILDKEIKELKYLASILEKENGKENLKPLLEILENNPYVKVLLSLKDSKDGRWTKSIAIYVKALEKSRGHYKWALRDDLDKGKIEETLPNLNHYIRVTRMEEDYDVCSTRSLLYFLGKLKYTEYNRDKERWKLTEEGRKLLSKILENFTIVYTNP
jgi:tetratricopeptide (TPR) repeat protein